MPTEPNAIATPPTPPARSDISTFVARADAWVAWEEVNAPNIGQNATVTYDNAAEAYANAVNAASAAAGVSAALWVSGTTYAIGDVRRSPANQLPYRRLTSGAGTTDPSADGTNWIIAAPLAPPLTVVSATTVTASAWNHYVLTNAAASTLTLPASPLVGAVVWITVANNRVDNVVARNGQNIMGLAENMTLNDRYANVALRYISATLGWRII